MTTDGFSPGPFKVVIVGGGVAALEAAIALRDLGRGRMETTIVAPNPEFVYRPLTVQEPFAYPLARRYPLAEIAGDIGADLLNDSFRGFDAERRIVYTRAGCELPCDALLLALGARLQPRYEHATTIDDSRLDELLHGLIQDVEGGYTRRLAFVVPTGPAWPLPIYELALLTAVRAYDMNMQVSITIATPEDAPLAIFGLKVSERMRELLEENGIMTITSAHSEVPESRRLSIRPGSRELQVDRIVALPELIGPAVPDVPGLAGGGFIPVTRRGRVKGMDRVYAAGDATDFPIKHGGIASQQADVAAQSIAALAGVSPAPDPFKPVICGMLLTGREPLYLTAHLTGGHGFSSHVGTDPAWAPAGKIASKYLAPFLDERDRITASAR